MIVESIEWMSEEASEALVTLNCGNQSCTVFSQPCAVRVGQNIDSQLYALLAVKIRKSESEPKLVRVGESLSYEVVGELISKTPNMVSIHGLRIEIEEPIPSDIEAGSLIQFECSRLDL